jgi:hypothetical protein
MIFATTSYADGISTARPLRFGNLRMEPNQPIEDVAANDLATGFPGVRSWRAIYLIVGCVFVLYVVLLSALSRAFQ